MSKKNLFIIFASITTILVAIITTFILINNKNDKPQTYKVTFNSNGGTAIKEQIVNAGEKATKPNDPTKEGYLFVEWQYNNITFNFATKIEKDITLIAKWQEVEKEKEMITVRFETDGGTTISNQIIESGTKITKPEAPIKEGYIFKGWYYNDEEFNFDTSITEDIEIKARWEEEPKKETEKEEKPTEKKYTVTFNSNGGSEVKKQEVKKGSKATKPSNPIKDSYVFINWTLDGKEYNFDTKITKNITLVANWGLLGDVNNDGVINGKDDTRLMRYLSGWDVEISTIVADVNSDGEIDDVDVAVLRKYLARYFDKLPYDSGKKYTITYNLNGGKLDGFNYKKYSAISLPYTLDNPEKEGYVFIGWTGSNGNTPQLEVTIEEGTTGNLEYNANWLLYGDVANDNKVDIGDSILIQQYIEGTSELTKSQKLVADVNLDSKVDDIDVKIIRDYLANKIDKLPYTS